LDGRDRYDDCPFDTSRKSDNAMDPKQDPKTV
jgi:hypothetical protein